MTSLAQRAAAWIENLPSGVSSDEYTKGWAEFSSIQVPVVTVFGSYDTGKSSLIRRLLVDQCVAVPDWLTISARHETFDINEVEWAGCLLRDTPGLAVGAADVRGESNTALALDALGTTDVALVVITPQLATGERDTLLSVISGGWTSDNLFFAISRFDEAGADPDDDLDEYRRLAARKVRELRESLHLAPEFPVHVVSTDFAQYAGSSRDVVPEIWDETREWDGMEALARSLAQIAAGDLATLRAATEDRYWRRAVRAVIETLNAEIDETEPLVAAADVASLRHRQSLDNLDCIDRAARAELKGAVAGAIRQSLALGSCDVDQVRARLLDAITNWFEKHQTKCERLLQDGAKDADRRSAQPSWDRLEEIAAVVRPGRERPRDAGPAPLAPHVSKVGEILLGALREFEKLRPTAKAVAAKTGPKVAQADDSKLAMAVNLGPVVLNLAVQVVGLVDEFRVDKAAKLAEHVAAEELAERLSAEACALALEGWDGTVEDMRVKIAVLDGAEEAGLAEGLRSALDQLRSAVESGRGLLAS